ncbi:MAG: hypothetical protein JW955_11450 [Sedimentisphaerales bacterium]|nr:hypothetical protein [Sedimentisphaerales bacterium]
MNCAVHHVSAAKCLVAAVLLALAVGVPRVLAADDITGEWAVTADSPWGPMHSTLTLERKPDGPLTAKWGASSLSKVKLENGQLTFTRTIPTPDGDMILEFRGTLKDGKLTGALSSDQGDSNVTGAKRRPMSPAGGVWDLKYAVRDRDMTAKLTVSEKPDGALDAKWVSERGESVVSNVQFQEGKLTFDRTVNFNDREMNMTFVGTVQGDKLTGVTKSQMGEIPVNATRLGAGIIGKWELTSVSDMGTWTTLMTINPDLSGRYEFFSEIPMKDIKFENGQLTFAVEFGPEDQRFHMDFKGKVEGQTLKGQMTSDRGTSEITGKRLPPVAAPAAAPASSIVGMWEFTRETQQGTRTNTLKIKPDMTGTYSMRDNEFPVTDLKVNGDQVTFKVMMRFNDNEVPMEFQGKLDGKTLKGEFTTPRGAREAVGKKVD